MTQKLATGSIIVIAIIVIILIFDDKVIAAFAPKSATGDATNGGLLSPAQQKQNLLDLSNWALGTGKTESASPSDYGYVPGDVYPVTTDSSPFATVKSLLGL